MNRAYTVAEVDEMRSLVRWALLPRQVINGVVCTVGDTTFHGMDGSFRVTPAVDPAYVEDRLRTYMMAGIAPDDLREQIGPKKATADENISPRDWLAEYTQPPDFKE